MEIILSNASPKPIYEQITSQIKAMIMNGELKAGDPMPSMRKLAKELHVSVITTQRAYDDLQKDGFIVTVPAKGNLCICTEPGLYPGGEQKTGRTAFNRCGRAGKGKWN